ncbi:host range and adsorption protein [Rahnella phage Sarma103]|nr:host range and adsorption protein [Rahnella phage Sarma103]
MGLFKKIKKAVSKVVKTAASPLAGLTGANQSAPEVVQAAPAATPAAEVETPKDTTEVDESVQSESDKKRARSGGKKSLSVTRSSGAGVNI